MTNLFITPTAKLWLAVGEFMEIFSTEAMHSVGLTMLVFKSRDKTGNVYKQKRRDAGKMLSEERFSLIKGINIKLSKKMFRDRLSLILLKLISVFKIALNPPSLSSHWNESQSSGTVFFGFTFCFRNLSVQLNSLVEEWSLG